MSIIALAYPAGGERHPAFWPFVVSFTGHLFFFLLLVYFSFAKQHSDTAMSFPSVIDVQMVEMPDGAQSATKKASSESEKSPVLEKAEPIPHSSPKGAQKAEVSIAPKQPNAKTALKYKTFKTKNVLENTLEKLEKKVEAAPPKPLEDTIKRLRDKVDKEGKPDSTQSSLADGNTKGTKDGYAAGSKKEGELIDIYRTEVAFTINKHWAFSEQLAGGEKNLVASVVFKVMPDGSIEGVFFTERSGNAYLDDSALKAIVKSSPVRPLPEKLNVPYVEMGVRFTPKGVQ